MRRGELPLVFSVPNNGVASDAQMENNRGDCVVYSVPGTPDPPGSPSKFSRGCMRDHHGPASGVVLSVAESFTPGTPVGRTFAVMWLLGLLPLPLVLLFCLAVWEVLETFVGSTGGTMAVWPIALSVTVIGSRVGVRKLIPKQRGTRGLRAPRQRPALWQEVALAFLVILPCIAYTMWLKSIWIVKFCVPHSAYHGHFGCGMFPDEGMCLDQACLYAKVSPLHAKAQHIFAPQTALQIEADKHQGITVMLMNYGRPDLLLHAVLPTLCSYSSVAQVIVSHGLERTSWLADRFAHRKVLHRLDYGRGGLNERIGVARRFKIPGDNATSPWVLIMDDDIIPTEKALNILIDAFAINPNRIVGKWGRRKNMWPHTMYDSIDSYGDVEVVLTKFYLVKRDALSLFEDYADVIGIPRGLPAKVLWNGEDIFMSHVHMFASGNLNYILSPGVLTGVEEVQAEGSISGNVDKTIPGIIGAVVDIGLGKKVVDHAFHRTALWGLLEHRFNLIKRQMDLASDPPS